MILVFGGTTEGRKTAALLESMAKSFVYSTKTKIDFKEEVFGKYRYGVLNNESLKLLIEELGITSIIHASHPFAENLTETIFQASSDLDIPVYYIQREFEQHSSHPLVYYVSDYAEAKAVLTNLKSCCLLALTGVQSIEKLKGFWNKVKTYFRILDRPLSLAIAKQEGVNEKHLIFGYPSTSIEEEREVVKRYNCDAILTKESGESGFLNVKIGTAIKENIPIVIIKKPEIPRTFHTLNNYNEIKQLIILNENQ